MNIKGQSNGCPSIVVPSTPALDAMLVHLVTPFAGLALFVLVNLVHHRPQANATPHNVSGSLPPLSSNLTDMLIHTDLHSANMSQDHDSALADYMTHLNRLMHNQTLVDGVRNVTSSLVNGNITALYLQENVIRPASYVLGQNLRLLGNSLWHLGHRLKQGGYAMSNIEPYITNASESLTQYGVGLVNQTLLDYEAP